MTRHLNKIAPLFRAAWVAVAPFFSELFTPRRRRFLLIGLGLAVVFGMHFWLTLHYHNRGHMGSDEGFYALAARNVMEGKIPYRDFGYTQMPLLPYLNGVMMEFIGYGLLEQRAANICWGTLSLLGIILAVRQRWGRWEPGLMIAFCAAASPYWADRQGFGTTNASAGLFLTLSFAAVLTSFKVTTRALLFSIFAVLAIGCRLSCAPPLVVLALILIIESTSWKQRLICIGLPIGVGLVLLLPFYVTSPENFIFYNWDYHLASSFDRRGLHQLRGAWLASPASLALMVLGCFGIPQLIKRRQWSILLLLLAAWVGVVTPMLPKSAYGVYITPVTVIAGAAGVIVLFTYEPFRKSPFRHAIWILPALILVHRLPREVAGGTATQVQLIGDYVRKNIPPGPILTPLPIVAIEAGRPVIERTDMGMFAAMHPSQRKQAQQLKLTTLPHLIEVIENRIPVAIVKMKSARKWNFQWAVPSLRRQPKRMYRKFEKSMREHYHSVKRGASLDVLIPKTERGEPAPRGQPAN